MRKTINTFQLLERLKMDWASSKSGNYLKNVQSGIIRRKYLASNTSTQTCGITCFIWRIWVTRISLWLPRFYRMPTIPLRSILCICTRWRASFIVRWTRRLVTRIILKSDTMDLLPPPSASLFTVVIKKPHNWIQNWLFIEVKQSLPKILLTITKSVHK